MPRRTRSGVFAFVAFVLARREVGMARDWPADLWPTSFKGIPFWTKKVDAEFGKRLQKDQFPEQDLLFSR